MNRKTLLSTSIGLVLGLAIVLPADAAVLTWGCTQSTEDTRHNPLAPPVTYQVYVSKLVEDLGWIDPKPLTCTIPTSLTVPDPPGQPWFLTVTATNILGASYKSNVLKIISVADGTVVVPPPPPPPPPSSLQVYSCPEAGANGRVLENDAAGVLWPNCPTAACRPPLKSLVVGVNTGAQPSYWRKASDLVLNERVWACSVAADGAVTEGPWTRLDQIPWGTEPPVIPPVDKILLTVGGDVWVASPNYTNFGWKLGAKAGTIAKDVKCDAGRRIGTDTFRVTAPIIWLNGKKDYVVAKCELR